MTSDTIGAELLEFLARHVHSVAQLEILCLLAEDPARTWRKTEVFKHTQSSHESVASDLRYFHQERLLALEPAGGYRFSPETQHSARLVAELARIYRERPVTLIAAIYRLPIDPIRQVAEASRLRKSKP